MPVPPRSTEGLADVDSFVDLGHAEPEPEPGPIAPQAEPGPGPEPADPGPGA
ncbi:hypothetical protein [Streptomyces longwoodensis]|uniref:hypothetical protein n=1 Tax=Streptomyces longwoodensis TaxID=68231 RepID=UPI0022584979|nr:hypothetical protein [Streptomyces longwoodensis]MCX4993867.1 hypothetical protein [Streptomyces longwoodensis]